MGAEYIRVPYKKDTADVPPVPPGFIPLASFTLKKIQKDDMSSCMASADASGPQPTKMDSECSMSDDAKFTRSLRRRPWINYRQFDNSSDEESDTDPFLQESTSVTYLPKGVFRGCIKCHNCQQVTAGWRPEDARRPILDAAPVFYPNEEEFKDPLKYITGIRQSAEPYGICRIIPPPSWNPPCPLREKNMWENAKFSTRVQRIDKLQNRVSAKKMFRYYDSLSRKRRRLKMGMGGMTSNGDTAAVNDLGFYSIAERFGFEPGSEFTLEAFQKYADDFKEQYFCMKDMNLDSISKQDELQKQCEPTIENIEGEYWRMVEKPTEEIEVLYGADIEARLFGSGFPQASSTSVKSDTVEKYVTSGWNLNNFSRLPGSVLSFESGDISGVLVPWLYVGMCFSSFCWHVEDHHLYSLNYMHWGAPKMWYGVPGKDAIKLEAAMKKHLPDLFEEQPDLLHKLVTQLSPSILTSEGVPVYRCIQHPGEFVLTFPRAYHSGFNCGFNCAEAVNVAPVDWFPHGQSAVERYREQGRKTTISHDKLLLGASREAVRALWELKLLGKNTIDNLRWKDVCGEDGVLTKALKVRVEMERLRREYLSSPSQSRKMDGSFDATCERECVICLYDLHLSAAGCHCCADKFACLSHAKQLCSCAWSSRFFLFRYEIDELNVLVEALGGKLSATYRWANQYLGLSLSSYVNKNELPSSSWPAVRQSMEDRTRNKEPAKVVCSKGSDESLQLFQEASVPIAGLASLEKHMPKEREHILLERSRDLKADSSSHQKPNVLSDGTHSHALYNTEVLDRSGQCVMNGSLPEPHSENQSFQLIKDDTVPGPNSLHLSSHGSSQDALSSDLKVSLKKKVSSVGHAGVINLSDDEGEEVNASTSDRTVGEPIQVHGEASVRLGSCHDSVSPCNYEKDRELITPETNASVINEIDATLLPATDKEGHLLQSVHVTVEDRVGDGKCMGSLTRSTDTRERSFPAKIAGNTTSVTLPSEQQQNILRKGSINTCNATSSECDLRNPQPHTTEKPIDQSKNGTLALDSSLTVLDRARPITEKPSCTPNNLDGYYRQKGPRIAKVVRRVNCTVELMELGTVLSGKSWSNTQAIFPKGFRSRVRYLSVHDPTKMCSYLSEILDAGLLGPVFMVRAEQSPSEVFMHVSASKCWDMVRERVNNEIRKQHGLGGVGLPPLQPPGCLDGNDMFGFSSLAIIQAIESLDCKRVCSEYWKSRPGGQASQSSQPQSPSAILKHAVKEEPEDNCTENQPAQLIGGHAPLRGLFKKANLEELRSLHGMLSHDWNFNQDTLIQLLEEEIRNR